MTSQIPVLAVDGPSGSGKGAVSRQLATRLGWHLLDSGALYRLLALAAQDAGVTAGDPAGLASLARGLRADFGQTEAGDEKILLAGRDVARRLRTEECGALASQLAAVPAAREGLKDLQRSFRRPPGLVADGRDMGTVIFPDAGLKLFLTASAQERAQRRYKQLKEKGLNASLDALFRDISTRDERDQTRAVSPLRPAADAVSLDTTEMGIEQVVGRVLELVRQRWPALPGT
jgi:cytidylate kinase